jgi:hypothetical protein
MDGLIPHGFYDNKRLSMIFIILEEGIKPFAPVKLLGHKQQHSQFTVLVFSE